MIDALKILHKNILILSCFLPFFSLAQLSPGDLSEAHAHLEGLSNCTQCHVLTQKVSNDKCLACHDLLNQRIASGKGFHSSSEVTGNECTKCHSDHHGRNFQMIRFDTTNFNHALTGYELAGAHNKVSCSQCHQSDNIAIPEVKKLKRTYLGLKTDCLNCHDDFHENTLPGNCIECHSYESFKSVPNFNHSNASFPLKGKHREVACEKCHPVIEKNGTDVRVLKGLEFSKCTDCHNDIHNNKFGQDCKKCHSEQSFHAIIGINSFDHSKTGYPLEGKHSSVSCEKCHITNFTTAVKHNLCMDCHDDYHQAQFNTNGNLPDCARCHSVQGFKPSRYTIDDHQLGIFPLEGGHLATPCFSCHRKEDKWQFRQIGRYCADCHLDIHEAYLDKKYYPDQACKNCHSMESWKQIGFNHSLTKYELTGAHQGPSCRACHQSTAESGKNTLRFTGIESNCVNCHNDKHAGQFVLNGETDCSKCHEIITWKASLFDHDQSRFPLDGKHDQLSCVACHKPASINGILTTQYKFEDIRCESCHL